MRDQRNALLVRRYVEEVLEGGNLAGIDDLLSPDVVMYLAGARQGVRGVATFMSFASMLRSGLHDLSWSTEEIVAEGEMVSVPFTWRSPYHARFTGSPSAGGEVPVCGCIRYRLADGKIDEAWIHFDTSIDAVCSSPAA